MMKIQAVTFPFASFPLQKNPCVASQRQTQWSSLCVGSLPENEHQVLFPLSLDCCQLEISCHGGRNCALRRVLVPCMKAGRYLLGFWGDAYGFVEAFKCKRGSRAQQEGKGCTRQL